MVPPAKRKYKIHDTATDLAGSHVMILSWAIGIGDWSDQGHRDGDYDWWLYKSIIVEKMTVQNVFLSFPSKYNILFFKCWSWIDLFVFNWQIFLWHSPPSSHLQSPYLCISQPGFLLEQKQLSSVSDCPDAQSVLKVGQTGHQLSQDPDLYSFQRNSFLEKVKHLFELSKD